MKSRLINVRLDEARLRKARLLRRQGVVLSDLVREAIDARFEASERAGAPQNVKALIASLFERYPDRAGVPARGYQVRDASAARAAIRRKLTRR